MVALVRTLAGVVLSALLGALTALLSRFHEGIGSRRVTRRTFLRNAVLGSVGVVLIQAAAGFVYFFWPNKTGAFGKEINVPVDQIPEVGGGVFTSQGGKFYIINNEDGALAIYWKCVHLGCTVPWDDGAGEFHCPCHGSVYDRFGLRIAGPAPRPMDLMPMRQEGSTIIVDTNPDNLIVRSDYDPSQALKIT